MNIRLLLLVLQHSPTKVHEHINGKKDFFEILCKTFANRSHRE